MFPIDPETKQYHAAMIQKFDLLVADKNYPWKLKDILPKILVARGKRRNFDTRRCKTA